METRPRNVNDLPRVLALDKAGNPLRWIDYKISAFYYSKELVVWSMGQEEFDIFGGTNAVTGERSKLTIDTIIAIDGYISPERLARLNHVALENDLLFRRDLNICGYCGGTFSTSQLTRDHIHPQSRGGKNIWTNVVTACNDCNREKDDMLLEEWGKELLYVPYAPNRAEKLILENRRILANQMDFLAKGLPAYSRAGNLN